MLEALTGLGLASAAGLNAYIPLVALGLLSRFTGLMALPAEWAWLENGWVLGVLVVLMLGEFVADKVPAVDSVNDVLQTLVRPTAGGIVFASGVSSETVAVTDPGSLLADYRWVPIVIGIVVALAVHLAKSTVRPVANTATAGASAPVLSVAEDAASAGLVLIAIVLPVVVLLILAAAVWGLAAWWMRRRSRPT